MIEFCLVLMCMVTLTVSAFLVYVAKQVVTIVYQTHSESSVLWERMVRASCDMETFHKRAELSLEQTQNLLSISFLTFKELRESLKGKPHD